MAKHLESGLWGEKLAQEHLVALGFEILHTNWRYKRLEVDIVAREGDVLVFVEVKSRQSEDFGQPYEFVDKSKQRNVIRAANAFLQINSFEGDVRFDIVSVYLSYGKAELIRDAFWSD